MKFCKILFVYLFIYLSTTAYSAKLNLRNAVHNGNNMLEFKDTTNNIQPTKTGVLEDVIQSKATSIIAKSDENVRFKEREALERSNNL